MVQPEVLMGMTLCTYTSCVRGRPSESCCPVAAAVVAEIAARQGRAGVAARSTGLTSTCRHSCRHSILTANLRMG